MDPSPASSDATVDARRARLARRRDVASPLADPARGRQLRAHGASIDRGEAFAKRLDEVRRAQARAAARARLLHVAAVALRGACVGVIALVGPWRVGALSLVAAGAVAWLLLEALVFAVATTARRRGASAWDWQAGRHRLLGDPSSRVRDLDRPDRPA